MGQKSPTQVSIFKDSTALPKILNKDGFWPKRIFLGYSKTNKYPVYAYYYNRGGTEKAMIIAGVHGSEFYGVEVAKALKDSLDKKNPKWFKWKILLIPSLLIENVENAEIKASSNPKDVWYRETSREFGDPNRQMPRINQLYKKEDTSATGGKIEIENQYLLQLVQVYNPARIASIHCKHHPDTTGIYADPRTDTAQISLGYSTDSTLAIAMANVVKKDGGIIRGNFLNNSVSALYPLDPPIAAKDSFQPRTFKIDVPKDKKVGVSFGTWASTEIYKNGILLKKAATVLTLELPQHLQFFDDKKEKVPRKINTQKLSTNTNAYVKSLLEVFLSNQ